MRTGPLPATFCVVVFQVVHVPERHRPQSYLTRSREVAISDLALYMMVRQLLESYRSETHRVAQSCFLVLIPGKYRQMPGVG